MCLVVISSPRIPLVSSEHVPAERTPRSRKRPNATTSPTAGRLVNGRIKHLIKDCFIYYIHVQLLSPSSEPQPPPGHGSSRNLKPKSPEETRQRFTSDKASGSGEATHNISGGVVATELKVDLIQEQLRQPQGGRTRSGALLSPTLFQPDSVATKANFT